MTARLPAAHPAHLMMPLNRPFECLSVCRPLPLFSSPSHPTPPPPPPPQPPPPHPALPNSLFRPHVRLTFSQPLNLYLHAFIAACCDTIPSYLSQFIDPHAQPRSTATGTYLDFGSCIVCHSITIHYVAGDLVRKSNSAADIRSSCFQSGIAKQHLVLVVKH